MWKVPRTFEQQCSWAHGKLPDPLTESQGKNKLGCLPLDITSYLVPTFWLWWKHELVKGTTILPSVSEIMSEWDRKTKGFEKGAFGRKSSQWLPERQMTLPGYSGAWALEQMGTRRGSMKEGSDHQWTLMPFLVFFFSWNPILYFQEHKKIESRKRSESDLTRENYTC